MSAANKRRIKNIAISLAFPVVVWLIMEVLCLATRGNHVIGTMLDVQNLVRNTGISICSSLALCFTLGNGRFDLSVGAQRMAAAVLGGNLAISMGFGPLGAILCAFLFGVFFGTIVGGMFVITRIPAMVLGIGMALIYECVAFVGSNSVGLQIYGVASLKGLSSMYLCIAVIIVVCFVIFLLDNYTTFGFYNKAIHGSQKIAHDCGINIFSHAVICYAIAGGVAGLSGILDAAFKGSMEAQIGFSSVSTVMSCCFPMWFGKFIARWTGSDSTGIILAALTIRLFQTGISVMRFSITAQNVFVGVAFLVFLIIRANTSLPGQIRARRARVAEAKAKKAQMAIAD